MLRLLNLEVPSLRTTLLLNWLWLSRWSHAWWQKRASVLKRPKPCSMTFLQTNRPESMEPCILVGLVTLSIYIFDSDGQISLFLVPLFNGLHPLFCSANPPWPIGVQVHRRPLFLVDLGYRNWDSADRVLCFTFLALVLWSILVVWVVSAWWFMGLVFPPFCTRDFSSHTSSASLVYSPLARRVSLNIFP